MKLARSNKEVKSLLQATYPEYKGRKIRLETRDTYQMENYWSGGTKHEVMAYDLATGKVSYPNGNTTNPMTGIAHSEITIPDGVALVEHTIFCGHDIGITIMVNSNTAVRQLEEA